MISFGSELQGTWNEYFPLVLDELPLPLAELPLANVASTVM